MGRKKVNINANPLKAQTIGKIKQNRFGWIWGIILIAFFVGIIYYLPEIQILVDKYVYGKVENNTVSYNQNTNTNINKNTNNTIVENKIDYLTLENQSYSLNKITISDINLNENHEFSFSIESNENINLINNNYFLEFYDNNKELVERKYLYNNLTAFSKQSYKTTLKNNFNYFSLLEIDSNDFDYFMLDLDENNRSILNCQKNKQTISYNFLSEKLDIITDTTAFDSYTEDIQTFYDSKAEEVSKKDGYEAYFDTNNNTYVVTVEINKTTSNNPVYYFYKDIMPREVRFKIEALGYTCK